MYLQELIYGTSTWSRTETFTFFSPRSRGFEGHADGWINSQDGQNSRRDAPDPISTDQPEATATA
uniref:Uncharacterized protein n=1 Tax=Arundo donax TaxID=35708 RepID=A0A0A9B2S1_ARUDO